MIMKRKTSRKGLSHDESKAQTRARLIAVGRRHFLRYGFNKAIADDIAKEAGYTRGAIHSNFGNKEGLLLEIARESHKAEIASVALLVEQHTGKELFRLLRETVSELLGNPHYLIMLEFEVEALRNQTLHAGFLEFQSELMVDSRKLVDQILRDPKVHLAMEPDDLILAIVSFSRGLGLRQLLLKSDLPRERSRRMMAAFFDNLVFHDDVETQRKDRTQKPAGAKQKEGSKRKRPKKSSAPFLSLDRLQ